MSGLRYAVNSADLRGPSLLEFLDKYEVQDRDINAPFMLPVSEKYNELGTCCMGKIGVLLV